MRAACPLLLSAWLAFAGQIAPNLELAEFWRVAKSWELRDGIATPHEPEDLERARNKKSTYAGMREEDFIAVIEKLLAEQKDALAKQPRSNRTF